MAVRPVAFSCRPKGAAPTFPCAGLDFHHQFAAAAVGVVQLLLDRIVLAFLEADLDAGQRPVAPFCQPGYRHCQLTRKGLHRFATQQAQHNLLLPPRRPALDCDRRRWVRFQSRSALLPAHPAQPQQPHYHAAFPAPSSDTTMYPNFVSKKTAGGATLPWKNLFALMQKEC